MKDVYLEVSGVESSIDIVKLPVKYNSSILDTYSSEEGVEKGEN